MQADARGREYVHERTLLVFLKAAARLGIDIDAAAKAPTRYRVGADTLVPTAEYQAVLHAIFADPRETLGIELARAMPTELSGLWGFLLRSSPTYGDMLRRAERYIRLFFRFTRLTLSEDGSDVVLVCDHPDPSPFGRREQEVCFFLGQWLTWGRDIVGHAVKAEQARMRWRGPAAKEQLQSLFGCPIAFGAADDALIFRRDVLDLPLPEQTPELDGMFDVYAAAAIRRMTPQATFVDRVREALSEGLLTEATNEVSCRKAVGHHGSDAASPSRRVAELVSRDQTRAPARPRGGAAARAASADCRSVISSGLRRDVELSSRVSPLDRRDARHLAEPCPTSIVGRKWVRHHEASRDARRVRCSLAMKIRATDVRAVRKCKPNVHNGH